MRVFDLERAEALELVGNYGAWIPEGDHPRIPFTRSHPKPKAQVIWVAHTTHYRGGSAEFAVAAATMGRELAAAHPDAEVVVSGLHHKADFTAELAWLADVGPGTQPIAPDQPRRHVRPDVRFDRMARAVFAARVARHENPVRRRRAGIFPRLPDGTVVRAVFRRRVRSRHLRQLQLHHRLCPQRPLRVGGSPSGGSP